MFFGGGIVFLAVSTIVKYVSPAVRSHESHEHRIKPNITAGLRDNLLDSSPFAAYSLELPKNAEAASGQVPSDPRGFSKSFPTASHSMPCVPTVSTVMIRHSGIGENLLFAELQNPEFPTYTCQSLLRFPPWQVSWTILPEHEVLEHALHWRSGMDATGGQVVIAAVLEQSLSSPRARLRIGTCYERK